MSKKLLSGFATAGLLFMGAVTPAQAIPLSYTLQDVRFSDGATAAGSFIYDADTRIGTSFSVSTTAGVLSAFTFDGATSGFYSGGGAGPNNFILFTNPGDRYFNFSFLTPLTNAGGTYALNTASSYECNNCGTFRMVVAGAVSSLAPVSVPEPATAALLLPSLGIMGLFARRRKQVKA
jgi:hypothetical protein